MRCRTARSRSSRTSPMPAARERIFAAAARAAAGAAAGQQCGAVRVRRFRRVRRGRVRRAHGGQCARAAAADARRSPRRTTASGDALIVNMLDAKLAAPNPDFLSYTLSKQALAGLTELAARALAAHGHPGQCDRAGADAALGRAERGEFRRDARRQPAAPRRRAGRRRRRAALSDRGAGGDRPGADHRRRAALLALDRDVQFLETGNDRPRTQARRAGARPSARAIDARILLDALEVQADIGFHDFEVGQPQRLLVTVEIWLDDVSPPDDDDPAERLGL